MIKSDHKISFETKMVVKPTFSGEFVHLPVPVEHSGMCSVPDPVAEENVQVSVKKQDAVCREQ